MTYLKNLQDDNVYIENKVLNLKDLTGLPVTKGLEKAIVSGGTIVNVVSAMYGHLDNANYFPVVEEQLEKAGIKYMRESVNRSNLTFKVNYILQDESIHVNVKNGMDKIKPMLSFTNAYDGSIRIAGEFGFYREVCKNGLHVSEQEIAFKIRRRGDVDTIAIERIDEIIKKFVDNDFYSIHKKFEVLAERPIKNIDEFVKMFGGLTGTVNYAASEKNPDKPSKNAKLIMETIDREAKLLHTTPNMWLGYNAFNEFIHSTGKSFDAQKLTDKKMFNIIDQMSIALS